MGDDVRVASWSELNEALYDVGQQHAARYRSGFVYRGVGDIGSAPETSLVRLAGNGSAGIEGPMLRAFRKYAPPDAIPAASIWITLSVARHHLLPTRLLDWTLAPRVALHFATADLECYDRAAAIWCVDLMRVRERLPAPLQEILLRENALLFSVDMLEAFGGLRELDELGDASSFVLFFEPPSLDMRIVSQSAVLSVMQGAASSLHDVLRDAPELWHRVLIPAALKWEVRDKLDQDNVTGRILFPGLDGLSRWLKR
jgi:hypothetical protein